MCLGSDLHSLWTTYSQMHPDRGRSFVASYWAAIMIFFWHNLHSQQSSSPAGALDSPPCSDYLERECLLYKDQSQATDKLDLSDGFVFFYPQIQQHTQHQQGMWPAKPCVLQTLLRGRCSVSTVLSSELML